MLIRWHVVESDALKCIALATWIDYHNLLKKINSRYKQKIAFTMGLRQFYHATHSEEATEDPHQADIDPLLENCNRSVLVLF